MQHRSTPFRHTPDDLTKAELEAIGLGDPTLSLRRRAVGDLFAVGLVYILTLLVALALDLGDIFLDFVRKYEHWEIDEFIAAGLFSMTAFAWFAVRQWRRYADEVSRRLKLEEDLVEMRVMADHLGENKSLFLANLAHDFRTPLNGILGFAQLLDEEPFGPIGNERYKTYITTIRESAAMLNERIDTCLDPDKIEFGAEPMQMIACPLKSAIDAAMPIVQAMAQSASITVQDDVSNDLPMLHADGRALKKILVNLVTSAIKHSRPKGTVRISARMTEEETLVLRVEDGGVGLDPMMIETLTLHDGPIDPHDNGADSKKGIGLFVVKKLLKMHDATFAIENRAPAGTTVTVTFPPSRLIYGS